MISGWIKLHRQFLDWEWYSDHNVCRLFLHCLIKANHKPKKWRGILIESGSFVSSRDALSKETGLSVQQIRTCINKLKSTGELTSKNHTKFTYYSITYWEKYQDTNQQVNQQSTSNQPAINQQSTTNKNVKNDNNEKKKDLFVIFWQNYKKKTDKKKTEISFNRLTDANKHLAINDCVKRYEKTEKKYVPGPLTYINGEKWNDENLFYEKSDGAAPARKELVL